MGLRGAALALTTSHALEPALMLAYILVSGVYRRTWPGWSRGALQEWGPFLSLALPSFLMMSEWCVLSLSIL